MHSNEFITVCPFCGQQNEMASGVAGAKGKRPGNGSVSLCMRCGELAVFDDTAPTGVRKPTDDEYTELGNDLTIRRLRQAWVHTKADQPGKGDTRINVLDWHFQPFEQEFRERGHEDITIHRVKTMFALGMWTVFRLIEEAANDEEEVVERLEALHADVDDFLEKHPRQSGKNKGEKP